jgi:predicted O-methyltransferase YrrM
MDKITMHLDNAVDFLKERRRPRRRFRLHRRRQRELPRLLRGDSPADAVGGLVFDNTLWHGLVIDPNDNHVETVAVRALNDFLPTDWRVETIMLPLFDGMTLARKR